MRPLLPALIVFALCVSATASSAEYPPKILTWLDTENTVLTLAGDGAGRIFYTDGRGIHVISPELEEMGIWLEPMCSSFGVAANSEYVYGTDAATGSDCANDNIFKFARDGTLVTSWCPSNWTPGSAHECAARHVALGQDGSVFVNDRNEIRKYDPDGVLLATWQGGGTVDFGVISVGGDGCLYATDQSGGRVLKLDPDLTGYEIFIPHGTGEGTVTTPVGLTFDDKRNLYVMDRGRNLIQRFNPNGTFSFSWERDGLTGAAVVDEQGYMYVGVLASVVKYDNEPGTGPDEAVPPHPAAIFLHVGKVTGQRLGCIDTPVRPAEVVTQGSSDPTGRSRYYVYLFGTPHTLNDSDGGLTGMQLGIEFTGATAEPPEVGVFGWTPCSVLDFPQDGWPQSGTGNTITWNANPSTCLHRELVVAGFMYVSAYEPTVMSIAGFPAEDPNNPSNGLTKVTNCVHAELVVADDRRGWVSFGGASIGGSDSGCNPIYGPCEKGTVPVRPTTWGRIKTQYRN